MLASSPNVSSTRGSCDVDAARADRHSVIGNSVIKPPQRQIDAALGTAMILTDPTSTIQKRHAQTEIIGRKK